MGIEMDNSRCQDLLIRVVLGTMLLLADGTVLATDYFGDGFDADRLHVQGRQAPYGGRDYSRSWTRDEAQRGRSGRDRWGNAESANGSRPWRGDQSRYWGTAEDRRWERGVQDPAPWGNGVRQSYGRDPRDEPSSQAPYQALPHNDYSFDGTADPWANNPAHRSNPGSFSGNHGNWERRNGRNRKDAWNRADVWNSPPEERPWARQERRPPNNSVKRRKGTNRDGIGYGRPPETTDPWGSYGTDSLPSYRGYGSYPGVPDAVRPWGMSPLDTPPWGWNWPWMWDVMPWAGSLPWPTW